jgi:serine kinase of HPr protein (carbohydrate metabolism regulator)
MSESIHASAVLCGGDGVLIRGESGSGKSALALALIERGGKLVADDRLMLSAVNGRLIATPPGPTAGQIELRGRGLIGLPHERGCVIRLVADIVDDEGLERMPEPHQLSATVLGIALARQPVPASPDRGVRLVEAALSALAAAPAGGLRMTEV